MSDALPDNVVLFPGASLPIGYGREKRDNVFDAARERGVRDVVVLGWQPDGTVYVASEDDDIAHVLALIMVAQNFVADLLARGAATHEAPKTFDPPDDAA